MAEIIKTRVSVVPTTTEVPTIVLDADAATLQAGGDGLDGQLELFDDAGRTRVRLNAGDGSVVLRSSTDEVAFEASSTGNLTLGGPSGDGDLYLKDMSGTTRIELDAQNQLIRFRNAAGQEVGTLGPGADIAFGGQGSTSDLVLRDSGGQVRASLSATSNGLILRASDGGVLVSLGSNGNLSLGGAGNSDGDIYLRDAAGTTRIELDAQNQLIRFRNASNQEVGRLGDNANLRLGGHGIDGDVILTDSQGQLRLELNADGQYLRIRNSQGNEVGRLGENANLVLGGYDSDGDVDLYDGSGRRRILLNADGNSLSLYDSLGRQVFSLAGDSNMRLGGHGTDGDLLLFPSSASDIFATSTATIHLDANAGDITLRNADCAEEFEILPEVDAEPGTVMALGDDGRLVPSDQAGQTSVVGVVSGAGSYQPGIVLDRQPGQGHRRPIALVGKAYVKVTDEAGPVRIGDLLTPSSTPGHAMRVVDPAAAAGSVIGKAIAAHGQGSGLIPMVISLQ